MNKTNEDVPFERQMLHIVRNYQKLSDLIYKLRKENDTLRKSNASEAEFQRQAEKVKSDNNMLNYRIGKLQDTVNRAQGRRKRRPEAHDRTAPRRDCRPPPQAQGPPHSRPHQIKVKP